MGLLLGSGAEAQAAPHLAVAVSDGRLSITARAVSLEQVLAEIGRRTGIRVSYAAGPDATPTRLAGAVAFDGLTLEHGLRELLRERNYLLVFAGARLAEVRIYGASAPAGSDPARGAPRATRPGSRQPADRQRLADLGTEALAHPDPRVRSAALDALDDALATTGETARVVELALRVLERERDDAVIRTALRILGDHESVPLEPLLGLAARSANPSIQIHALEVLSRHATRDARVKELFRALLGGATSPEVRKAAADLLEGLE